MTMMNNYQLKSINKIVYLYSMKMERASNGIKTKYTYYPLTQRLDSLLPIGTVVKSVNGVAVTPENICEYKDLANQLLNKDGKWWKLDIVFEEKK